MRAFITFSASSAGKGIYFTKDASLSARKTDSPADSQGHRHMMYCRVLTGHSVVEGRTGARSTDNVKDATNVRSHFDSIVDRRHNPTYFIVYQEMQAYPEYLVTFK